MNAAQPDDATIFAAGPADLDEIMAVMEAAFDPAFGEAWTRAQCAGILGLPGVRLLIARDGRGAAGFALLRAIADEAELLLIAVPPSARRRGTGAALLAAAIDEARLRGATRFHLEMRDDNPARAFYRAAGFAEVGRRRAYYRGRDGRMRDAITLALDVPS